MSLQRTVKLEYRFQHPDGSWHWISDSWTVRRDETGYGWVVTSVALDITEQKRTEQSLQESEEMFRVLATHVVG